ncbi:uncharacterized protein B0H18DRAFT_370192 [Fomitopsis serialis]|uniref:uncharacterized protein n=1 Tax=Fomitopsis serialis TaxID=139415 RepID=UPI002008E317|nr:uncharacterized protein B0H18DRAFT_370192 [Neoantrodia serialis]KAH9925823.1 hypothetical protein B0H18DRAFT_370192 [Neoantrodia serialis]
MAHPRWVLSHRAPRRRPCLPPPACRPPFYTDGGKKPGRPSDAHAVYGDDGLLHPIHSPRAQPPTSPALSRAVCWSVDGAIPLVIVDGCQRSSPRCPRTSRRPRLDSPSRAHTCMLRRPSLAGLTTADAPPEPRASPARRATPPAPTAPPALHRTSERSPVTLPTPPTPSVILSVTTPRGDAPSITSLLDILPAEAPDRLPRREFDRVWARILEMEARRRRRA